MSLLKKLFGGGSSGGGQPVAELEYDGFQIATMPINENGQYRVCAMIRKELGGEMREHRLIRADICGTVEEASEISIRKAKQMIDERGERLFGAG